MPFAKLRVTVYMECGACFGPASSMDVGTSGYLVDENNAVVATTQAVQADPSGDKGKAEAAYSFTFHNVPALARYGFKNDGVSAPTEWVYNDDVVRNDGIIVSYS